MNFLKKENGTMEDVIKKRFLGAIWNTLWVSILNLVINFPAPIILALLINEWTTFQPTVCVGNQNNPGWRAYSICTTPPSRASRQWATDHASWITHSGPQLSATETWLLSGLLSPFWSLRAHLNTHFLSGEAPPRASCQFCLHTGSAFKPSGTQAIVFISVCKSLC